MARPIEATPVLYGEDAERLLASLEHTCSEEEMARRTAYAHAVLDEMRTRGFITVQLRERKQEP